MLLSSFAIRAFAALLVFTLNADALRSHAPDSPPQTGDLNLDEFSPLCDKGIVEDTCRLLNEGEKHAAELCTTIVSFVKQIGVLPPKSDISCYSVLGQTFCDVDVRPSALKSVGPKPDEDLPDFDDRLFLKSRGKNKLAGGVETAVRPGVEMDSDTPIAAGVVYDSWEALERLANLFRIYPDRGSFTGTLPEDSNGTSLLQSRVNRLGGMTPKQAKLNSMKEEMAKAYMSIVIRAFSARETEVPMRTWFGRDSFDTPAVRKEVLRVLNSVTHMISNVYYVYPGPQCSPNTYAYVYPKGGECEESEMQEYACRKHIRTKQFVFFLCPFYFSRPDEMVETLVHEGSHHATAYTDDVDFEGDTAYGRSTCKRLAKKRPLEALKNADNFCYYIQDTADQQMDHREDEMKSRTCPHFSKAKRPDNDGDCPCPDDTKCIFGGRVGCPFSATSRRKVYSTNYFNADCFACSCQAERTTTPESLDGGFEHLWFIFFPNIWDSCFIFPQDLVDHAVLHGSTTRLRFDWDSWSNLFPAQKAAPRNSSMEDFTFGSCPENTALTRADSHGDCYCAGGRHCYQNGRKGCPFSGTSDHERDSSLCRSSVWKAFFVVVFRDQMGDLFFVVVVRDQMKSLGSFGGIRCASTTH
eukprot:Skav201080  [mRNA]  locus=scaffold2138:23257:25850:- [translate_table: standard]